MSLIPKHGHCCGCNATTEWVLHLQVFANGSENFLWVCGKCNARNPGRDRQFYIPAHEVRSALTTEQIGYLPIIMPELSSRCARCGNRTAELHHWAPKAIFGLMECEMWPKDFLCKDCHDFWHRRMTPELVLPKR